MTAIDSETGAYQRPVSASFDPLTGFVLVNIDKISYQYLDQPVHYQGKLFQPKEELHITIISDDAGTILKHLENRPDDQAGINDLVLSSNWSYRKLPKFYYVTEEPDKETIIQMVDMPGLRQFLMDLSKLIGHGLTVPPTHVTLYMRGTDKGIGIPSTAAFEDLIRADVEPEEIQPTRGPAAKSGADQDRV